MEEPQIVKSQCEHVKSLQPIGQTIVNLQGKILIICSLLCTNCNQVLTTTSEIPIEISKFGGESKLKL